MDLLFAYEFGLHSSFPINISQHTIHYRGVAQTLFLIIHSFSLSSKRGLINTSATDYKVCSQDT